VRANLTGHNGPFFSISSHARSSGALATRFLSGFVVEAAAAVVGVGVEVEVVVVVIDLSERSFLFVIPGSVVWRPVNALFE